MKDNQAKYPQLRFKGFTDPWEQRKLGEIAIRVRGNDGRMNLPTLTISAGNGWMDQRDRFSQNIAGKEQKNYTLLRQGELSYNHGNSKLAQFGAVFELESYNEALVPRVYHSFSVTAGAQPKFIEQMFATHRPDRELRKLVSSGARMDGLLNINYDDFMGIKVWLPSVAEQQAIAGLLVKLDNTIALHQRKLAKLKELKQGYLQKLFPKNGSKFPQLRFSGFADAWEQRKLGELGSTFTGLTGKTKEDFGHGDAKFVTYMNVFQNAVASLEQLDSVEIDSKQNEVKKGDVFFTTSSETPEEVGMSSVWKYNYDNVYLNSFTFGYRPNIEFDLDYLAAMLRSTTVRKKITFLAQGISRYNISKTKMMDIEVPVPSLEEQAKIGAFLSNVEQTITLHQRKLEKLQELKKGYLQKMFC